MKNLFQPYVQAECSTARRYGGTGLGLAISQRFATMLGGGNHVESAPEEGSTFTLALEVSTENVPLHQPTLQQLLCDRDEEAPGGEDATGSVGGRVLVVDDNDDIRELIGSVVRAAAFQPTLVAGGAPACAAVAAALEDDQTFVAVLLDMRMPGLSGQETARRLRHLGYTGKIVALTAVTGKEREEAIQAGCNDHFSKPFRPSALVSYLRGLLYGDPTEADHSVVPAAGGRVDSLGASRAGSDRPDYSGAEAMVSEYDGDAEMADYITFFVERLPDRLAAIEQSLRDGDLEKLTGVTHDLKGISGTVGYPALSEQAEVVERMASDPELTDVDTLVVEAGLLVDLGHRVLRVRTT